MLDCIRMLHGYVRTLMVLPANEHCAHATYFSRLPETVDRHRLKRDFAVRKVRDRFGLNFVGGHLSAQWHLADYIIESVDVLCLRSSLAERLKSQDHGRANAAGLPPAHRGDSPDQLIHGHADNGEFILRRYVSTTYSPTEVLIVP